MSNALKPVRWEKEIKGGRIIVTDDGGFFEWWLEKPGAAFKPSGIGSSPRGAAQAATNHFKRFGFERAS